MLPHLLPQQRPRHDPPGPELKELERKHGRNDRFSSQRCSRRRPRSAEVELRAVDVALLHRVAEVASDLTTELA
jgi:hypothetical protein